MSQAYPLSWPKSWARSKQQGTAQFRTGLNGAMTNVQDELKRFAADSGKKISDVLISSNFSLGDQKPKDPGVACYFTFDGLETCIAVDRYKKIEHNLQAIYHCLDAERTKLRHGGINLVMASFRGYAALPPPTEADSGMKWWSVLGVHKSDPHAVIEGAYKRRRSLHHPDKGGDRGKFNRVRLAWKAYKAWREEG